MIKRIVVFITISVMFFASACLGREPTMFSDDDTKAEIRMGQIIEVIENRDKDALQAMFSEQALKDAEDLDERMDWLFDFVDGDIVFCKQDKGIVSASNSHGIKTKESRYWFFVNTDTEEYTFQLVEYTEDTEHPKRRLVYVAGIQDERCFQRKNRARRMVRGHLPSGRITQSAVLCC
jgi:hypothetical protein